MDLLHCSPNSLPGDSPPLWPLPRTGKCQTSYMQYKPENRGSHCKLQLPQVLAPLLAGYFNNIYFIAVKLRNLPRSHRGMVEPGFEPRASGSRPSSSKAFIIGPGVFVGFVLFCFSLKICMDVSPYKNVTYI